MTGWLIQIDAWQGPMAFPVRLASHDDERLCHLDGQIWWPAIAKLPTFRYDFFDGAFDAGSITSPSGSFQAAIEAIPALPALAIHDARIRIWSGEQGSAYASYTLVFDGRVKEQPTVDAGTMSVSFGADDGWLDDPLLTTYAGTGGAEGGEALTGQVKPLALGAPRFAPATLIDPIDNIYQLSGYGVIAGVETAFERLNRFGAPIGNAASFAALKAASVTRGQWATCLSGGFVRFGAPPDGMLCFHLGGDAVGGWSRLPGALIARVATLAGGAGRYAVDDIAALDAARPWPLSIMVTAQTTARDLIQRIAMSVNAVAYVDWLGQLRVAPLEIGVPALTIAADGSSLPPVASVEQVAIAAPYWKLSQSAAVTWQVHGLGDIAFSSPLTPRGPYDPAETYREGDMVTLPNGSQWLAIATAPVTGSTPADGNPDWFRLSDAITAGNISYEDGTTVEALKPAQAGADKTSENTADDAYHLNGRPAEEVISDLNLNGLNWHDTLILFETRDAEMMARTTLGSKAIGTVVTEFKAEFQDEKSAVAERFSMIGAVAGPGGALTLDIRSAMVSPTQSFVQYMAGQSARFGAVEGSVTDLRSVTVDDDGNVLVKSLIALNAAGHVVGQVSTNDGTIGDITFVYDRARWLRPNGTLIFGYDETEDVLVIPRARVNLLEVGTQFTLNGGQVTTASSTVTGTGVSTYQTIISTSVTLAKAGLIYAMVTVAQSFPSGDDTWNMRLRINGSVVFPGGGQKTQDTVALSGALSLPAGTYTVDVIWAAPSAVSLSARTLYTQVNY